jgi:hypothetical protein
VKRADAVVRYRGVCEQCPTLRLQVFYREAERDSFVRRHVLATHHRVKLIEEDF